MDWKLCYMYNEEQEAIKKLTKIYSKMPFTKLPKLCKYGVHFKRKIGNIADDHYYYCKRCGLIINHFWDADRDFPEERARWVTYKEGYLKIPLVTQLTGKELYLFLRRLSILEQEKENELIEEAKSPAQKIKDAQYMIKICREMIEKNSKEISQLTSINIDNKETIQEMQALILSLSKEKESLSNC
jgi:hypothetical protein